MANIPKSRKHCIPISLELIKISCIPLNIYKNIPYPFMFLAHIPVSLKPFQGLTICGIFVQKKIKLNTVKTLKKTKTWFSRPIITWMQVKSITERSKGSILQYFWASLRYHSSLRPGCCPFLSGLYWLCQVIHTCVFAYTLVRPWSYLSLLLAKFELHCF